MASISERESREIEAANDSGATPVVFIHGLWLLPSSWSNWANFFAHEGYAPLTPDWPDDPATVEGARAEPEVLAKKTLAQVADHTTEIIDALDREPALIGHSTGGLLAQMLAGRGLSAVTVAIRDIAANRQAMRKHDRVPNNVVCRNVIADLAIIGIHVVDSEAQITKAVPAEGVIAAGNREDSVSSVADAVIENFGARSVPHRDSIAGIIHAPFRHADDHVAPDDRVRRAVNIDAVEIALDPVLLDNGPLGGLRNEDARIHLFERTA